MIKTKKNIIKASLKILIYEKTSNEMPKKENENEKNINSNSVVFISTPNLQRE